MLLPLRLRAVYCWTVRIALMARVYCCTTRTVTIAVLFMLLLLEVYYSYCCTAISILLVLPYCCTAYFLLIHLTFILEQGPFMNDTEQYEKKYENNIHNKCVLITHSLEHCKANKIMLVKFRKNWMLDKKEFIRKKICYLKNVSTIKLIWKTDLATRAINPGAEVHKWP